MSWDHAILSQDYIWRQNNQFKTLYIIKKIKMPISQQQIESFCDQYYDALCAEVIADALASGWAHD